MNPRDEPPSADEPHLAFRESVADVRSPLAKIREVVPHGVIPPPSRAPTPTPESMQEIAALRAQIAAKDAALASREGILRVVAHDLRNPLALVKVGAGLIDRMIRPTSDGVLPAISADALKPIADATRTAVRRMERLITDLLDLGALDKGELRMVRGVTDLGDLLSTVAAELRDVAAERGVLLDVDRPPEAILVSCDRDRVMQLVGNLASNAIKFTPPGKRVTLRLSEYESEIRISVIDEGPGITDPDLRRIFDPYYRADVRQERGLGLGLSIALGIARAHDGAIWAESDPGHGTTFVFTMPRRDITRDTVTDIAAISMTSPRIT